MESPSGLYNQQRCKMNIFVSKKTVSIKSVLLSKISEYLFYLERKRNLCDSSEVTLQGFTLSFPIMWLDSQELNLVSFFLSSYFTSKETRTFEETTSPLNQVEWKMGYIVRRLIWYRIIGSAAYCDHTLLLHLYSTQNMSGNWIIRLLLLLLCWPKVILLSGGHCITKVQDNLICLCKKPLLLLVPALSS